MAMQLLLPELALNSAALYHVAIPIEARENSVSGKVLESKFIKNVYLTLTIH